ncbi:MAG TPA: PKD domain-containing protein [Solirubrobacterales bacterium]
MLHRQLLDRFLIAAAIVAAWALAAPAVDAARADAAQVTVVRPDGAPTTLSLEALAGREDVIDRSYALRGSGGENSQTVTGFSLAALIGEAGVDRFGFSYLEVQRPGGGAVQLSNNQVFDEEGSAEGPPLVYATARGTAFLRPSSGPSDLNAGDFFEAPQGVTIVLRKDTPLRVRVEASTMKTRPGERVEFAAEAEGAREGEAFTFSWHFDDGKSASGSSVTHAFAHRGSYDVVVGVTTPSDDTGSSAVVTIQVGAPLGGPDRKGGGKRLDASAPDHGAATGSGGTAGSLPVPGASSGGSTPAPAATESAPRPKPAKAAEPAPAGERVSGELLSLTAPAEPEPEAQQPGARAGSPDSEDSGGIGLSGAALGLLITGGLLGAGALTETRRLLG